MSKIVSSISDYLTQVQKLTNTNLQILKTINDSFYTKQNHLFAEVDDATYVIPSFLSLENKVNALQENFENLVKAPETCEAYFNFDGNTRAIEVRKYSHVPDSVTLPLVDKYMVESNDIFKDFLTPVPYINFNLPELPNDIVEVNVKKIVPKSVELKELFKSRLTKTIQTTDDEGNVSVHTESLHSVNSSYGDIYKTLLNYVEDVDYVEYDTIYPLPIRKNIGSGKYVIESVISDVINDDLEELITLKLRTNLTKPEFSNKLTYTLFDDTIEKPLRVGDELINYDGTGKVRIVEIRTTTNTIVVKVVNGEYLNFLGTDSYDTDNDNDIHDLSKLRFHSSNDFSDEKYIKVPLEEDRYVFVAIAPLNSRMNVQASWGQGVIVDAYSLMDADGSRSFRDYYIANVKNIGDVLFEMTSMITSPVTELSADVFNTITTLKPVLTNDTISVMQINKHLNNSTTVQNIRAAYSQKKQASTELADVQTKINDINEQLASISYDDTTGIRAAYDSQLTQLNKRKNELTTTITNAMDNISLNVNASEIPIENAKYRIRGFYVPKAIGMINDERLEKHVIGLDVQYRYKNLSTEIGSAVSMTSKDGSTYIFSDWNNMTNFNKRKIASINEGEYSYGYEENNENKNEPSFNQIDIPISQGETVDIRVRLIYDFGQPYIHVTSAWSDIFSVKFPDEFTKDIPILTIIEENNSDIEANRFNKILADTGVEVHTGDKVVDQDITYYHKPESIASGFYTSERRIIPLKDKLVSMENDIASLKADISGSEAALRVGVIVGDIDMDIYQNQLNTVTLESYNNIVTNTSNTNNSSGGYIYENGVVTTTINISISNTSDVSLRLFPVFPGSRDIALNMIGDSRTNGYVDGIGGVYYRYRTTNGGTIDRIQSMNQFITFRTHDVWDGTSYYTATATATSQSQQSSTKIDSITSSDATAMVVYPFVEGIYGLCVNSNESRSYLEIAPGNEVVIPLICQYVVKNAGTITKKISFDLRTSLYKDPTNYTIEITGKNTVTIQDKVIYTNRRRLLDRVLKPIKYYNIVK